jgi:hypothetical protein
MRIAHDIQNRTAGELMLRIDTFISQNLHRHPEQGARRQNGVGDKPAKMKFERLHFIKRRHIVWNALVAAITDQSLTLVLSPSNLLFRAGYFPLANLCKNLLVLKFGGRQLSSASRALD